MSTESEVPPLPEVRICNDPENPFYGSTATKSDTPFGGWLIANPGLVNINAAGGHWEPNDSVVNGWKVLS